MLRWIGLPDMLGHTTERTSRRGRDLWTSAVSEEYLLFSECLDIPTCLRLQYANPKIEQRRAPDELLQVEHGALDAGLRVRVVVLDAVQQLAQAPVRVRLHLAPARPHRVYARCLITSGNMYPTVTKFLSLVMTPVYVPVFKVPARTDSRSGTPRLVLCAHTQ